MRRSWTAGRFDSCCENSRLTFVSRWLWDLREETMRRAVVTEGVNAAMSKCHSDAAMSKCRSVDGKRWEGEGENGRRHAQAMVAAECRRVGKTCLESYSQPSLDKINVTEVKKNKNCIFPTRPLQCCDVPWDRYRLQTATQH